MNTWNCVKCEDFLDRLQNFFKFITSGTELQIVSFTSVFSALHGSEGSEHKLQDYDTVQSSIRGQNFEGMYLYDKSSKEYNYSIFDSECVTLCSFSISVSFDQNILCHKTEAHYSEHYSVLNGYSHAARLSSDITEGQHTTVLSSKALLCTLMLLRGSIGEIWLNRFLHQSTYNSRPVTGST